MVIKKNSLPVPNLTFINFFNYAGTDREPKPSKNYFTSANMVIYDVSVPKSFPVNPGQNLLLTKFLSYHK
jgi:hypothetical protein